jgi:hypothetical protein
MTGGNAITSFVRKTLNRKLPSCKSESKNNFSSKNIIWNFFEMKNEYFQAESKILGIIFAESPVLVIRNEVREPYLDLKKATAS